METKLIAFIQSFFRWVEKIRWKLIFNVFICIVLAGSVIYGFYTRQSYDRRSQDPSSYSGAVVPVNLREDVSAPPFNPEEAYRNLEKCSHVMLVKHISSEQAHMDTKSTVEILQVFRGNGVQDGDKITVFENPSFHFNGESFYYDYYSYRNRMLPGVSYLIFVNEKELDSAYKESLEQPQFVSGLNTILQSFKLAPTQTKILSSTDPLTYSDIQNEEFVCFDEATLNSLNQLKEMAFQTYNIK